MDIKKHQTVLKFKSSELNAWFIPLVAGLFFFYEFMQLDVFNTFSQDLSSKFHLTTEQLGILSSYYFLGQILFLLPAGILLDKFSIKKILLCATTICIVSVVILVISNQIVEVKFARFLTGVGAAFSFLSCLKLINQWISNDRAAFASACIVTIGLLGGMAAQTPMLLIANAFGWQNALIIDAFLGIIILLMIVVIVQEKPLKKDRLKNKYYWSPILNIKKNWFCSIYTCCMNLPVFLFSALWGNMYLAHILRLQPIQASWVNISLLLGVIVGAPILGFLSDVTKNHQKIMLISSAVCLALSLIIFFLPPGLIISTVLLFTLLGFFSSAQCITYSILMDINDKTILASVLSLTGLIIMFGGLVCQPLWGFIAQHGLFFIWTKRFTNEHLAFFTLILGFFMSIIASLQLQKRRATY